MKKAKLEIVGDPAWMQQGEVSTGINWPNFNFNPFNADGGINFDSQQVLFDISFNQPTDYNFSTGLMDVNSNNTPTRIDRNELYLDIAIEPVKAVEFIYIPLRIKNTGEIAAGK